ncbi:hypothetical protein LIS82_22790 [Cytobacillus solani]|uniref:Na+/H+ antiporter NhaC family protein n=1 Tax=Cytobacillus solani TaxID=1637975 RepID=UPI0009E7A946|nr:Na+/H+ antiporter NhaC family protein [Cytobacillus solani]USK54349.1 hypothetical protein LIS82_22790 [Cytobacillus solani]
MIDHLYRYSFLFFLSFIALIGTILTSDNITEYSAFSAFMQIIPMNLYVWATLAMVFIVAFKGLEIGPMKVHERHAVKEGLVADPTKPAAGELKDDLPTSTKGSVGDLLWSIIALIVGTVGAMLWTGIAGTEGSVTVLTIFENTDVTKSLILGGLFGLIVTLGFFIRQVFVLKGVGGQVLGWGVWAGTKSMLPAVYILLFAWVIADLIGRLETGKYLAGIAERTNLNPSFLPLILLDFIIIAGRRSKAEWQNMQVE